MAHIGKVLIGDIRYDGRVRKEIDTLVKAGHQVELVVSDYSRTASFGKDLGIKIHYIPMPFWKNPIRNFCEILLFNRKAASILKEMRPTHLHCHDLDALLAGVWAKKETKSKLVFDAHELFPEHWGGIRERVWNRIEKMSVNICDHIIMPEKNRIAYFKKKYPNSPAPLLLENYPSKESIPQLEKSIFREMYPIKPEQSIVLYTGVVAHRRYIEELIRSMSICGDRFVLVILGRFIKNYDKTLHFMTNAFGLNNRVFLHDAVPHTDILSYMASCDMGVAFYRNTNINNYYCAPNKVYEYIALEKVVLTNDYPGLLEYVGCFRQGMCLPEITPESLAQAYVHASDPDNIHPGSKKYFWEDREDVLVRLYAN